MKSFTVNDNNLPLIEFIVVNSNKLPLTKLFIVNGIISR